MKTYAVQKQLIPIDKGTDPNWSKRQIWVYRLNSDDTIDEYDSLQEAISKRDLLDSNDPTNRIYRVVKRTDKFSYEVIK